MATLGLRKCFEFVTRETFEADGETGLSDPDVLKRWLEAPPPDASPTTTAGSGGGGGGLAAGLDSQQEDSVFLKSYIPRTLNEVYDPERDLEAVKKGGKTIYSDTIGVVNSQSETSTPRAKEGEDTIEREKPKVRFSTGVELEDETHDTDVDDEGEVDDDDDEEEKGEEDEGEGEPRGKIPRGHKHEDKEAKKVRRIPGCRFHVVDGVGRNARKP